MASNFTQIWTAFIQPSLTPVVALIGAVSASFVAWRFGSIQAEIARQQAATAQRAAETARNKLKLELFERRLRVYETIYAFMREVPALPAMTDFTPYFQSVREVRWLFETPVVDWVYNDLFVVARQYQLLKIRRDAVVRDGADDFPVFDALLEMENIWTSKHDKLVALFDPYLRLEH